jgi:hypothetical protein
MHVGRVRMQAVALVFDHALLPDGSGIVPASRGQVITRSETLTKHGGVPGRETAAVNLLSDLLRFCSFGQQQRQGTCTRG